MKYRIQRNVLVWTCDLAARERLELPTCGFGDHRSTN